MAKIIAGLLFVSVIVFLPFGCKSTVNSEKYTINATAGANGSISPSGDVEIENGNALKFTFTPDAGYVVDDVLVDTVSVGAVLEYTFSDVQANHTIEVSFIGVYTITALSSANGTIAPTGAVNVNHGDSQTFNFTPDAGFSIVDVQVDAASVGTHASYTFSNVVANHTIHVSFVNQHTITATNDGNGTITPTGAVLVNDGANQAFTITADAGWVIDDVEVDSVSVGAVSDYTFQNVQQNHTIHAVFVSVNVNKPATPVRLIFMHHSCGNNWLNTSNGNLGNELGNNNYYVRDTYYGWDALLNSNIGSSTDIGHWYTWFADTTQQSNHQARRDNIMGSLYTTNNKNATYDSNLCADPGGETKIIMFKSCYPSSNVYDNNNTVPSDLYGQPCQRTVGGQHAHTLNNTKEVYRQILVYMKTKTDKMFVVITAPPLYQGSTNAGRATNARTLNNWLVEDWLDEGNWENKNVYVFDLYNVLTDVDNHHRVHGGNIQFISTNGNDYAHYITGSNSHPTSAGNQKSTTEYVPLLNVYFHRWWNDYLGN